jgi:hypothetical protein
MCCVVERYVCDNIRHCRGFMSCTTCIENNGTIELDMENRL